MRIAHLMLMAIFLISGCSFTAADSGDNPDDILVPTRSNTPSPTDELQLATDTPRPSTTPSFGGIEGELIRIGSECAQSIPGLRDYQASLELPEGLSLLETVDFPLENGIDLNHYFSYLDELSIEPGFELGYVYFSDIVGGRPLVYAHPSSQPAYTSYEAYILSIGADASDEFSFSPLEDGFDYLAHIQVEDGPLGYFQYAALSLMGDQFYLFWHALYHDEVILCGQQDINLIEASIEEFGLEVPADVLQEAQDLDLEPFVVMGDDAVVVRFVYFSKWGGLAEALVTVDRSFPHEIMNIEGNLLVEYDCGIAF